MDLAGTQIEDTFAEAFGMRFTRLWITAHDEHWLDAAIREFTGYSASVIVNEAVGRYCEPAPGRSLWLGVDLALPSCSP